jgi:hypothetical protein
MENSIIMPAGKQENIIELSIIQRIHEIRGVKVILDFDLAERYGVETRRLNEAVKRNIRRFPPDFMFQLTKEEWENLISQIATSSWGGTRKLPYAFTEQGIAMLSGLLNSDTAIDTNIVIMRAFVMLRRYALNYSELKHELDNFMRETKTRLDNNNINFEAIFKLLDELISHKKELEKPSNPIGFRTSELIGK